MLKISLKLPAGFNTGDKKAILDKHLTQGIAETAAEITRNIRLNIQPGWGAGMKSRLNYFTGGLLRSWGAPILEGLNAKIGSTRPDQALMQEYGGEIRPVKAKALFIPLTVAAAKIGAQKDKSVQRASGLIFGTDFAFAQRVNIKPKGYISRGIETSSAKIPTYLGAAISRALEEGLGTK